MYVLFFIRSVYWLLDGTSSLKYFDDLHPALSPGLEFVTSHGKLVDHFLKVVDELLGLLAYLVLIFHTISIMSDEGTFKKKKNALEEG